MKKITIPLSIFILLLGLAACSDNNSTGPDPDRTTGGVKVTVTTTGTDIDEDGYTITTDGKGDKSIGSSGSIVIMNLDEGPHELELTGAADNCKVDSQNPQTLTISAGETASAGFDVSCTAVSSVDMMNEVILTGDGGFGFDVQVDGNRAIVGAPGNDDKGAEAGAAYIYELQNGSWTQTAKLTASDGAAGDLFGHTVAIDGNRVLVSAHGRDKPAVNAGAAYVFELQGGTWVETQILTAMDAANPSNLDFARMGDQFGRGLAMEGKTILVGAYNRDASGLTSGEAYIFELQGDKWVETQQILPADISKAVIDPPGGDNFGRGVAISGNTIVVGSPADDDKGAQSGSAYIFEKQNGTWVEAQKLTASDGEAVDGFGFTLSIDGDRLVVGVANDDDAGDGSGSAYVFERQGGTWTETQKLTASDAAAGDFFGFDAAVRGDVIVVGAEFDKTEGPVPGSYYIFKSQNGSFAETDKITAKMGQGSLNYGSSVALSDDYIFVGSSATFPQIPNSTEGAVYIYQRK